MRCWHPADAPLLKAAIDANIDHLVPWMPWIANEPEPLDQKVQRLRRYRAAFDRDEDYTYGLFNASESQVLGGTGLHTRRGANALEIGYWIHRDRLREGIATELSGVLTRVTFAFTDRDRVEIHCDPRNAASAGIPAKLGFTLEATRKRNFREPDGTWRDSQIWVLFRHEAEKAPLNDVPFVAYDAAGQRLSPAIAGETHAAG
jgi:RimJ/RimL family protein N-acetyltransferase